MSTNFACYEKGQLITADGPAVAVALAGGTDRVRAAKDVLLYNPGPLAVQVLAGEAGAVADASCAPLPAGAIWVYGKGRAAYLSAYCSGGSQPITVMLGEGQ
jgi:hypothetical protein